MHSIKEEDLQTMDGLIYLVCEFCEHWKDGEGPCNRKFKPILYTVIGGKNPELHHRKQCFYKDGRPKNWVKATDIETVVVKTGFFDCNAYV